MGFGLPEIMNAEPITRNAWLPQCTGVQRKPLRGMEVVRNGKRGAPVNPRRRLPVGD
jgi:hypothetical protein